MSIKSVFKPKVIIVLFVLPVVLVVVAYFYTWRLPSADYEVATKQVSLLKVVIQNINDSLGELKTSSDIGSHYLSSQSDSLATYSELVNSIKSNTVIVRDHKVATVFKEVEDSLTDYEVSFDDLLESLYLYQNILDNCSDLVDKLEAIKTKTEFKTASGLCNESIISAKTSPDTKFSRLYLNNYTTESALLLTAYEEMFPKNGKITNSKKIDTINANIASMRKIKLSFNLTPDPTSDLKKLAETINKQKDAFLR